MSVLDTENWNMDLYNMYKVYTFSPIIGLSGAGKSDFLQELKHVGKQVLSIENLLNVRGICLKNILDTVAVGQDEFDALLWSEFDTFDKNEPIYIEWKPLSIIGIKLRPELVRVVREASCYVKPVSRKERISRIMGQYAEWSDHMDIIAEVVSARMPDERGRLLRSIADSGKAQEFVMALLTLYFDPLYIAEIAQFNGGAFFGDLRVAGVNSDTVKDYFLGSFDPAPSLAAIEQSVFDLD